MKSYIKLHIWEYIFVFGISIGLSLNVFSAFLIDSTVTSKYLLEILLVFVLDFLLFLAGYNKKSTIVGLSVGSAIVIISLLVFRAKGYLNFNNDVNKSLPLLVSIIFFVTIFSFLMTRKKALTIVLFLISIILCASYAFLQYPVSGIGFFIMIVSLILEIMYKVYYDTVFSASYGNFNFKHFFLQSICVVLVVIISSVGVYMAIIKPLSLPTRELKLTTKLMSWDILDKIGVSSETEIASKNNQSNKVNDNKELSNQKEDGNHDNNDDLDDKNKDEDKKPLKDQNDDLITDSNNFINAFAIYYNEYSYVKIILIVVVTFLLLLPFIIKLLIRRIRWKKINSISSNECVGYVYCFLLDRFGKVGLKRPKHLTLYEFADKYERDLLELDKSSSSNFAELTEIYNSSIYGNYILSDDDAQKFINYYSCFYSWARKRIGNTRYIFKSWIL